MLKAALSQDQTLVAVIIPSKDRGVIQIFQRDSGLLQSTLTTRKANSLQANSSGSTNVNLQSVQFCGNHHIVAKTPSCLLVWDLNRGGVVSQTLSEDKPILAWTTTTTTAGNSIAVLTGSSANRRSSGAGSDEDDDDNTNNNNLKLQVIQYNPTSGKVERKIKCKKGNAGDNFGIAFATTTSNNKGALQLLVRCNNGMSIFDCEAGKRIQKVKHRDSKKKSTGYGGTGLVACRHLVAFPRVQNVMLYNLKTNQWLEPVSASSQQPIVHLWQDNDNNEIQLLVDNALYKLQDNFAQIITKIQCNHTFALLPASQSQLTAVLHNIKATNKTSIQVQSLSYSNSGMDDVTLKWQKLDDEETKKQKESNKRTADRLTVLGPGQAGGEHTGVQELLRKKPRLQQQQQTQEAGETNVGMSVAERLKKLSQAYDNDNLEEEAEKLAEEAAAAADKKGKTPPKKRAKWVAKHATTESLSKLLGQALEGGDNTLLEMALGVSNRNVIQETLAGLDPKATDLLLTKLILRLANVPAKADNLAQWTSLVITGGKLKDRKQLTPLRNLLTDRCDYFPYLMMMEGKLTAIEKEIKERRRKEAEEKARVEEMRKRNRAAEKVRKAEAAQKAAEEAEQARKKAQLKKDLKAIQEGNFTLS